MTNCDQRGKFETLYVSDIDYENSKIGYCCNFEAEPKLPVCLSFAAITEKEICSPHPNSRQTGTTSTVT